MTRLGGSFCASVVATLFFAVLGTAHCGPTCDRDPGTPPVVYEGGITKSGVYTSSDVSGPLLDFPPGRTYRFMHHLGVRPLPPLTYLAFDAYPIEGPGNDTGRSSNLALSAGNQAVIEAVTDEYIDVRNDTCADGSYLYVLAIAPGSGAGSVGPDAGGPSADDAGAPDASGGVDDVRQ